jgi:hypothetical protein
MRDGKTSEKGKASLLWPLGAFLNWAISADYILYESFIPEPYPSSKVAIGMRTIPHGPLPLMRNLKETS